MKKTGYIVSNPNILAGTPVVQGTRIPVSRILYLISQGCTTKEIKKEFPQLTINQINKVIALIARKAEKGEILSI